MPRPPLPGRKDFPFKQFSVIPTQPSLTTHFPSFMITWFKLNCFLIIQAPLLAPVKQRWREVWERGRVFIASKTNFHSSKSPNHALWQKTLWSHNFMKTNSILWLNLRHSCLMRNYWLFCVDQALNLLDHAKFSARQNFFFRTEFGNKFDGFFQILRGVQFCLLCPMASWCCLFCFSPHDSWVRIKENEEEGETVPGNVRKNNFHVCNACIEPVFSNLLPIQAKPVVDWIHNLLWLLFRIELCNLSILLWSTWIKNIILC